MVDSKGSFTLNKVHILVSFSVKFCQEAALSILGSFLILGRGLCDGILQRPPSSSPHDSASLELFLLPVIEEIHPPLVLGIARYTHMGSPCIHSLLFLELGSLNYPQPCFPIQVFSKLNVTVLSWAVVTSSFTFTYNL